MSEIANIKAIFSIRNEMGGANGGRMRKYMQLNLMPHIGLINLNEPPVINRDKFRDNFV